MHNLRKNKNIDNYFSILYFNNYLSKLLSFFFTLLIHIVRFTL